MKFVPIKLRYDVENNTGSVVILEAVDEGGGVLAAVGDTSIDFPLSDSACDAIREIVGDEARRVLAEFREHEAT